MKKIKIFIITIITATVCLGAAVFAKTDVPDPDRLGTVSITLEDDGAAITTGTFMLYRVGNVSCTDTSYIFVLTDELSGADVSLSNIEDEYAAQTLADYIAKNQIEGTELAIDENGSAKAEDLSSGLYLVVQTEACDGYKTCSPFFVSMPQDANGQYVYNIEICPKVELAEKDIPKTGDDSLFAKIIELF